MKLQVSGMKNQIVIMLLGVKRYFDGSYSFEYPIFHSVTEVSIDPFIQILTEAKQAIGECDDADPMKSTCLDAIRKAEKLANTFSDLNLDRADSILKLLNNIEHEDECKSINLITKFFNLLEEYVSVLKLPLPSEREEISLYIKDIIPSFVYYSNYGNLDSEIYLPYVVDNLQRTDLTGRAAAQARTLRVLFKFVKLDPTEILQLGVEATENPNTGRASDAEIEKSSQLKRVRSTLLESAETKLTKDFKEWWKQGEYTFNLQADGKHFRILVSDAKIPAKVELEGRSTGLQWFLSFYLVFLVESMDPHENCIPLLDEPGVSLHPLAQMDLIKFFGALSKENQIIYTTHSPFLIDANRLDQARKVYVDTDGTTKATDNLRKSERDKTDPGAAYAVHSALGLRVAESLMIGCTPVIVEGPSDQHYLSAIKTLLIKAKRLNPDRELVFPPCGGTPQVRSVAAILGSREDSLPYVLLDGDSHGKKAKSDLQTSTYQGEQEKVLLVDSFTEIDGSEIEDLIPVDLLAKALDKVVNLRPEIDFTDYDKSDGPIVPQIEDWAQDQEINLPDDWKIQLSTQIKKQLLNIGPNSIDESQIAKWDRLFKAFLGSGKLRPTPSPSARQR